MYIIRCIYEIEGTEETKYNNNDPRHYAHSQSQTCFAPYTCFMKQYYHVILWNTFLSFGYHTIIMLYRMFTIYIYYIRVHTEINYIIHDLFLSYHYVLTPISTNINFPFLKTVPQKMGLEHRKPKAYLNIDEIQLNWKLSSVNNADNNIVMSLFGENTTSSTNVK